MHTPSQIETMALAFSRRQAEALAALELPFATDAEMFECVIDVVANNLSTSNAEWSLFAATARLAFYGINDVPAAKRRGWALDAEAARGELHDAWVADAPFQAADHQHDMRREVAA